MGDEWAKRPPKVAVLGPTSWDEFLVLDRCPQEGQAAIVMQRCQAGGGTAANIAVALARLGISPLLVTAVGSDPEGQELLSELRREGVDVHAVPAPAGVGTDRCTVLVTPGPERTILWQPGARLRLGDPLPLDRIFTASVIVIDVEASDLRQFLVDLPAHIAPRVRLVGTLTYLAGLSGDRGLRLALQHDVLVGNRAELCALLQLDDLDLAVEHLREAMPLGATRLAAISCGRSGSLLVTMREVVRVPAFEVAAIDATGAGDAFAAGVVYGLLNQMPLPELGRFANAVGGLATRALGARTALPTRAEVAELLGEVEACS